MPSIPFAQSPPQHDASHPARHYYLDWIRVAAFFLLVLYHVGMYYVSWDWHVKSPNASSALEPWMFLTSPWRLSLLFFISGVASAFLFNQSPQGFLARRSWRLLLPLIFGMLVIVPPQSYYEVVEKLPGGYQENYLQFWLAYLKADPNFCRDGECLDLPTWNHLWFVAYLWTYTAILYLILRLNPRLLSTATEFIARKMSNVGIVLVPIVYLLAARFLLVARFESTHNLTWDWYNHAQYFAQFIFGFLVARSPTIWRALADFRWHTLIAWALSFIYLAWYFSHFNDNNPPPDGYKYLQRFCWCINQWAAIACIVGMMRRLSPRNSPLLQYLSVAVFPIYIFHQTLIIIFAVWLRPFKLHSGVESVLLIALTFGCCFLLYEIGKRINFLRPLIGLKWNEKTTLSQP